MNNLQQKIFTRLSRYVAVDTTSDPNSTSVPTTDSQISFAHQLAAEMRKIGLVEVIKILKILIRNLIRIKIY